MKRDMDLIREILLQLEEHSYLDSIPNYKPEEIAYHVSLLEDAGLVTQEIYHNLFLNDSMLEGIRITWAGHEFLDASRNTSLWEKAKKVALDKTGALSFEVLKAILIQFGKDAVFTTATLK
jgi:hypothetical protein